MLPFLSPFVPPASDVPRATRGASTATDSLANAWRLGLWVALYAVVAVAVTRPVLDADVWWHLRTGQWVIEHGTVPQTDPFSDYGRGRTWVAYSWLFEVLVYVLHRALGLHGVLLYRALTSFAVVAAVHRLVARRQPRFLPALGLVGAALLALLPVLSERPWLLTILFTTWTLDAVLGLREGRASSRIWLLPLVYATWANVHIQFVYGLAVLALACVAPVLDRLPRRDEMGEHAARPGTRAWRRLVGLSLACLLATFVNPYHGRLYAVAFEYATQPGPYRLISELTALDFRGPWDWAVLGLSLGAAFALGRRPRLSAFEVLLLGAAAYLSFRSKRDLWFVALAALALLTTPACRIVLPRESFPFTWRRVGVLVAAVVVIVVLTAGVRGLSADGLRREVAGQFPARAVALIEERGYEGPVYNHFNWGGYLAWELPRLPVGLDGRTNLHGDERILRGARTWAGLGGWQDDPELNDAHLVIADATMALTALLRHDARFEVVYEDAVGVVLVRRTGRR